MRKITSLLLGILMMTSASAAEYEYVPLVREGVVWEYVEYNICIGVDPTSQETNLYTLEFNGENEKGHMLYRTDYSKFGTPQEPYLVAYVKEENKEVTLTVDESLPYYLNIYTSQFDKIYDFNNNELFFLPEESGYYSYQLNLYNVCNLGSEAFTIEVGNTTRNGYHVNYDAQYDTDLAEFKIIEGIGADCMYGDLLEPFCDFPTGSAYDDAMGWPMAGLSAVYENGELVYKGCMYDAAQQLRHKKEDVDGDGHVTSVDVTAVYNILLGITKEVPTSFDVDGDGVVTTADITAIYNVILGLQ